MTDDKALYPPVDPVKSGLTGHCPRCGHGRLFQGLLKVRPSCSACGLDYSFADSGDGPVVFVILIVGFIVVGLALWMEVNFAPPIWLQILLWAPLAILLSLLTTRLMKGVLINLQFHHNAGSGKIDQGTQGPRHG
ncbi:hypothetical protein BJF93_17685 [Xaviernesmea oryzae]|uniref:DUF983 domain-containing protein n=1 Tax=Xaviernesmea oryzae TaxID=464029 RepID=A0A1Q9ATB9_9HYPH|nr:DUF983 domain-containing protein [Xaviernesmea oryzae]OLP58663.1 hypothetical protein BJF93_17685 [Xaviernesmea oryzae]SEK66568.1 Uncharacterized conserved protein, DUF983 family [Xaviernesmea oryzae]